MGLTIVALGQLQGDARRDTFVIFSNVGHGKIELAWSELPNLASVVYELGQYAYNHGIPLFKLGDGEEEKV